ncbi:MAG TPA: hypothetical protein VH062_37395 [Polyangiaceae bacterium]|jgi:hypothetical protein|nr:hypothetical protein [Polyangiaceae bacterium]
MRFRDVGVLASLLVAVACATGEDLATGHVKPEDAGLLPDPTGDTGGAGGDSTESGGDVGAGGTNGTGDAPESGGVPASGGMTGEGGKPAAGGMAMSTSGGKTGNGGTATGGGTGSGGTGGKATGTGGKASGNGGTSAGGSTSMGGDGGACPTGQKTCGGLCTPPAPRVGCGTTGCDACTLTAPTNGYVTCTNNQCAFDCLSGYTKMGDACMGSGNGQGGAGSCNASRCPQNCSVVLGPACCTTDGKCGCPLIPYVAPTCIGT